MSQKLKAGSDYSPSSLCAKINKLASSATEELKEIKFRIYNTTDMAKRCGALLLEEKSLIEKEKGRGYWTKYFEANHSMFFGMRTAQKWMLVASIQAAKTNMFVSAKGALSEVDEDRNVLRANMVALEIFPKKTNAAVEGEAPAPIRNSSFLVIGNRFKAWHAAWRKANGEAKPTAEQLVAFRHDIRELIEFLELVPTP